MKSIKVKDYMRTPHVALRRETPVEGAVKRLIDSELFGAPVVDDNNRLIGFISERDLLAKELEDTYLSEQGTVVGDLMRDEVLTVSSETSIIELAQMMVQNNKPKIYPVVDDLGRLVGIISRREVLKAINSQPKQFVTKAGTL